ncbi:MAG: c-type cytochrome [Xanthomonadales bacterium]|nr:c-type cytochrome [Pseudoxanthomonas sp.]MBP8740428.1 c-type cytochrome [Pseudoxanthomonas sp.]MBP9535014.1 c-type cytochrome [Pseudoxanthomonas sp.]MBP9644428.1 c-type cytochrome [Pseudoxanthomonas sp.]MDZ3797847.1 c-type cytochrome [Xanthomonadales bacterium]
MTCTPGQPCEEGRKRRTALMVLGAMAAIFVVLSVASFVPSRGQVTPDTVFYGKHDAVQGKRVFQAYNCMGCHTVLGNGAYLGPDLTNIYEQAGPAWLEAFLPSAGGWPTRPAVQVQLQKAQVQADAGTGDLDEYLKRFGGGNERVLRRGGQVTHMPNLPLTGEQVGQMIAFLKYTSAMNTEGWPPKPKVDGLKSPLARPMPNAGAAESPAAVPVAPGVSSADPVAMGEALVKEYACTACHAVDATKLVGPGWGGLYASQVLLADGSEVTADDAYLAESIRSPDAKIVEGYATGTMPAYETMLNEGQVDAIVAYIRALQGARP